MTKITIDRAVMEQALDYLDAPSAKLWPAGTQHRIITALRAALAEPVQEPVAWIHGDEFGDACHWVGGSMPPAGTKLYTAPPQRKPLTAEIVRLAGVALHEMPRPSTDWHTCAKLVCQAVVEHSKE